MCLMIKFCRLDINIKQAERFYYKLFSGETRQAQGSVGGGKVFEFTGEQKRHKSWPHLTEIFRGEYDYRFQTEY